MGTWGAGGFENDVAGDWTDRLIDQNDVGLINEALLGFSGGAEGFNSDSCCVAVVAAEVVAASRARPCSQFPEELRDWLRETGFVADDDQLQSAENALVEIKKDSTLAELWKHDGSWKRRINELLKRLGTASRPRRPTKRQQRSKLPAETRVIVQTLRRKGVEIHTAKGTVTTVIASECRLDDGDVALIALLPDLRGVDLSYQKNITDRGIVKLTQCKKLDAIQLASTAVTDKTIGLLSKLPLLDALNISETAVTDAALQQLYGLKQLVRIDVGHSKVTKAGLLALQERFPECIIRPDPATQERLRLQSRLDAIEASRHAMTRRDYAEVVHLLAPYETELEGADKRRIEIAQQRVD